MRDFPFVRAGAARRSSVPLLLFLFLSFTLPLTAAPAAEDETGRLIREVVRGKTLENTVTGENPDRHVSIYLPPGYDADRERRYPVVYLLHGIADTDETWTRAWSGEKHAGYATVRDVLDKGINAGRFGAMIVVMPDQKTKWFGSFYVNSSVNGDWGDFTAKELVAYIDKKYRTLAEPRHRAVAGHSMGGYGAITLSMKHPEVFGAAYGMNPAIIDWGGELSIDNPAFALLHRAKSLEEVLESRNFNALGTITVCRAFSPNPSKPPFYCDLPFAPVEGEMRPAEPGFTRWAEHSAINMVRKYRDNLRKLRGLRFDSGYEDEFRFIPVNSRRLSAELTVNGVEHTFEEYNGDHRNRLWGRHGRLYTEIFPWLWDMIGTND